MSNLLHILMGAERGGCEHDALCLILKSPTLKHQVLVLGAQGPMSEEFSGAGALVQHAGLAGVAYRRVVACVRETVEHGQPESVMIWHGMVLLPEILHALHGFSGRVLVHAGNPAHSLPRWVDLRYLLREWFLGRRCAAIYVCCSQYVADSLEHSSYLRRFPRVTVFNGVKPLTVPPHAPREIQLGAPFTIGMTARLDVIKDHALLLRAFARVQKVWPAARLELAGSGVLRCKLEQLARDLGVSGSVHFLGNVVDVYSVMRHWDIFAYATTHREGFGNALAEAMMLGLPCVVTDVGPMRELVGPDLHLNTYVAKGSVAIAEALLKLAYSYNERCASAIIGRQRALLEFAPDVFASRYLQLTDASIR